MDGHYTWLYLSAMDDVARDINCGFTMSNVALSTCAKPAK